MSWAARAAASLLPLSKQRKSLEIAIKEWAYTGVNYELEDVDGTCELCGHPDLRYEFQIKNQHNGNILLVGSECITKFNIPVHDISGRVLEAEDAKRKVAKDRRKLITDAAERSVIRCLLQLGDKDTGLNLEDFISYYREHGGFTPKQLSMALFLLEKAKVQYTERHFKMKIRRNREKEQLLEMPDWKVGKLRGCMSPAQRKWYDENRGQSGDASGDE